MRGYSRMHELHFSRPSRKLLSFALSAELSTVVRMNARGLLTHRLLPAGGQKALGLIKFSKYAQTGCEIRLSLVS